MHTYQEVLFSTLFASVATLAFAASLYLLLRPYNAFAADITPPVHLRRWTAAFFAAAGASQLYWLFIFYSPLEGDLFHRFLLCTALDVMLSIPVIMCTMLVMLQDRRRPLWPVFATMALYLVYLLILYIFDIRNKAYIGLPLLLIFSVFGIVLVRAVRQYNRWLRDNYADLEHKEVWNIVGVVAAFILCAFSYIVSEIFIEIMDYLFIIALLWRVETLQTLEESAADDNTDATADSEKVDKLPDAINAQLQSLLQQYCVDGQYYLKHDASLTQLASMFGTNRTYLSKYFAQQGLTYNTYINGLRIEHFIRLYQERTAVKRDFTARQLAVESGFRSYSTFSAAFKLIKGQTVADWMDSNS